MNYKNDWLSSCFGPAPAAGDLIDVKFKGRDNTERYTMSIFGLLATDKNVEYITSYETGEILYCRD